MLVPKFTSYQNDQDLTLEKVYKKIDEVEPFFYKFYHYEDAKIYNRFVKKVESLVRGSYEYRKYLRYLKEEIELTSCNFFTDIDINEVKRVGVEFHHYPFTLYDLTDIVISDLSDHYTRPINAFDVANDVMKLHFENLAGLVPLSKTVHELAHSGEVFINMADVFGNVSLFVKKFNEHINDELKDKLDILNLMSKDENYSEHDNPVLKKSFQYILRPDKVELQEITKPSLDEEQVLEKFA